MGNCEIHEHPLGTRARSGNLGYQGNAHAPAPGTYAGFDPLGLQYTTVNDSGRYPMDAKALGNLRPLLLAGLYEAAFAAEAGPVSTWRN